MKIVVRGTNWVGDAVMQIPALRRLREVFPDAQITLATRAWARGIFQDADFIDDFLIVDAQESFLSQARQWRVGAFDLAVLFTNSFETALVAALGKTTKRYGYANEGRSFLLTRAIPKPVWKNERHEIYYYLNLVAALEKDFFGESFDFRQPRFDLAVSETRKTAARRILEESGANASKKTVIFCPGSTNSRAKRWEAESYARLNDEVQKNLNANVVLIGDASELDVSSEVAAKSKIEPLVLTGKTTLAEATAILSVADLLISNDTGPAHIAAALGTKTVVIFGPTNPLATHPVGAEIIREPVECAPCMLRDCPIDHRCMTRISVTQVFEKAVKLLPDAN